MIIMNDKAKIKKTDKFKEWLLDWSYLIITVAAIVVVCAALIIPIALRPTYSVQATVTAVGYKGVTITYISEYGSERTRTINYNGSEQYQIGDTVTIKIKGSDSIFSSIEIAEGA